MSIFNLFKRVKREKPLKCRDCTFYWDYECHLTRGYGTNISFSIPRSPNDDISDNFVPRRKMK